MLKSGIAPIDQRLGGLTPRKPHLLTGPPGSGKSSICLAFISRVVSEGKSAAILTQDDPRELLDHATYLGLGLDLRQAAAAGRFVTVCYRPDFAFRLERAVSPQTLVDELVREMGPGAPDCVAVDSVLPFLDASSASGMGAIALTQVLDRLRATAIVTYPGDVREHYDRRLDPLVRRCAALLHLSWSGEGTARMDVVKSRTRLSSNSPAYFSVQAGKGIVPLTDISAGEKRRPSRRGAPSTAQTSVPQ